MTKYRIMERRDALNCCEYWVQKYVRLWYAPWKFAWVDAISWDDCGYGVPYFNSYKDALNYIKLRTIPIKEKIIYPK